MGHLHTEALQLKQVFDMKNQSAECFEPLPTWRSEPALADEGYSTLWVPPSIWGSSADKLTAFACTMLAVGWSNSNA